MKYLYTCLFMVSGSFNIASLFRLRIFCQKYVYIYNINIIKYLHVDMHSMKTYYQDVDVD